MNPLTFHHIIQSFNFFFIIFIRNDLKLSQSLFHSSNDIPVLNPYGSSQLGYFPKYFLSKKTSCSGSIFSSAMKFIATSFLQCSVVGGFAFGGLFLVNLESLHGFLIIIKMMDDDFYQKMVWLRRDKQFLRKSNKNCSVLQFGGNVSQKNWAVLSSSANVLMCTLHVLFSLSGIPKHSMPFICQQKFIYHERFCFCFHINILVETLLRHEWWTRNNTSHGRSTWNLHHWTDFHFPICTMFFFLFFS